MTKRFALLSLLTVCIGSGADQPSSGVVKPSGLALGPTLALATDVPLGQRINLQTAGAVHYEATNYGTQPMLASLSVLSPLTAAVPAWELGYEPIPDSAWFLVDPTRVMLIPGVTNTAQISVQVPADSRWANRRFVACVTLRPGGEQGVGAGLGLAARLLIETEINRSAEAGADAPLATVPSRAEASAAAGVRSQVAVLVRRNVPAPDGDRVLHWKRLIELVPEDERRVRYRRPGTREAAIATPAVASISAPDKQWMPFEIGLTAPAGASSGEVYEEILVLGSQAALALAAEAKRTGQPQVALIRCVIRVP